MSTEVEVIPIPLATIIANHATIFRHSFADIDELNRFISQWGDGEAAIFKRGDEHAIVYISATRREGKRRSKSLKIDSIFPIEMIVALLAEPDDPCHMLIEIRYQIGKPDAAFHVTTGWRYPLEFTPAGIRVDQSQINYLGMPPSELEPFGYRKFWEAMVAAIGRRIVGVCYSQCGKDYDRWLSCLTYEAYKSIVAYQ